MDTQRLILFVVFTFSLFLLWEAWQREQQPKEQVVAGSPAATPETPRPSQELIAAAPAGAGAVPPTGSTDSSSATGKAVVTTDVLRAEVSSVGGDLVRLELLKFGDKEDPSKRFVLFEQGKGRTYVAQNGLIGEGLPSHKTEFTVEPGSYELAAGAEKIELRLIATGQDNVKVAKVYTLRRGSYLIDITYEIENQGTSAISPYAYFQFLRDGNPAPGDVKMVPTYTGAAVFTEQSKYQKVSFSDMEKGKADYPKGANNGWIAMVQHYFVAAWLPQGTGEREFFTRKVGENLFAAGLILPLGSIEPGGKAQVSVPLLAGPQEQQELAQLAPGLDLVVDYGWLTFLSVPLFWVLDLFHKWAGNWGVAIILLTVLIKLLFYPLSAASYRSMARMKAVTPKLQRIKELYGDDRQRLHQAMMELYKTEKINPMGGCLPIVVQIPVFIALYWVLLQSVELRQAPFMLWIQDLSAKDPYYVLPVIMGATMFLQTRLNPTPPDPIQARMMQIMPIAFSIFFFFFPAGLVLYWLVNNVLSIAQQWWINRSLGGAKARA